LTRFGIRVLEQRGHHAVVQGRAEPVWDGGIVTFKPRMQYSAMTFSAPTRVMFDALYRPSVSVHRASDEPAGSSGPVYYESEATRSSSGTSTGP
jgi:hypothetical protein